jgi:hypothetical protein
VFPRSCPRWWCSSAVVKLTGRALLSSVSSEGRTPVLTAGVIDSQSVKTREAGRRKRHIATHTLRNMLEGVVHGAGVQDRYGAPGLFERSCDAYPTLTRPKAAPIGYVAGRSAGTPSRWSCRRPARMGSVAM